MGLMFMMSFAFMSLPPMARSSGHCFMDFLDLIVRVSFWRGSIPGAESTAWSKLDSAQRAPAPE